MSHSLAGVLLATRYWLSLSNYGWWVYTTEQYRWSRSPILSLFCSRAGYI